MMVMFLAYVVLFFAIIVCLALQNRAIQHNQKVLKEIKELQESKGYVEKSRWNEQCWVRALKKLEEMREDPEVTEAAMVLGHQDGKGHAWIEYRRGKDIFQYDPAMDKFVLLKSAEA